MNFGASRMRTVGIVLMGFFSIIAIVKLLMLLQYEMSFIHHGGDGAIYTAVGRGIVNGFKPYIDLFETKPPGMFFISAVSLWMFDDIRLANILQGLVELGMMMTIILPIALHKGLAKWDRAYWIMIGGLFGVLTVTYLAERAGHFQTESFCAFFVCALLSMMVMVQGKWKAWHMIVAGILLACAIGLKEPALFAAIAAILVLEKPQKKLLQTFGIPLGIAAILGILLLLIFGLLTPYLQIYLPEMIHGRSHSFAEPMWVMPFLLQYPIKDIGTFSIPYLLTIGLLWIATLGHNTDAFRSKQRGLLVLTLLGMFILLTLGIGWMMIRHVESGGTFAAFLIPSFVVFLGYWAGSFLYLRKKIGVEEAKSILIPLFIHIFAVLFITLTMGMGGFLQQQYGFGVPFFVALFFATFKAVQTSEHPNHMRVTTLTIATLCCIGVVLLSWGNYPQRMIERRENAWARRDSAAVIDDLMNKCNYDRYLIMGEPHVPYEFTKHSPYGPGFHRVSFVFPVNWRPPPQVYLQEEYGHNLQKTPFVIMRKETLPDGSVVPDGSHIPGDVIAYIETNFTPIAPECAKGFAATSDQLFLFRKL